MSVPGSSSDLATALIDRLSRFLGEDPPARIRRRAMVDDLDLAHPSAPDWLNALEKYLQSRTASLPVDSGKSQIISTAAEAAAMFKRLIQTDVNKGLLFLSWPEFWERARADKRLFTPPYVPAWGPIDQSQESAWLAASWVDGRYIHVPANLQVSMPLQEVDDQTVSAPFRRTVMIVESGASVEYVTGCLRAPPPAEYPVEASTLVLAVGDHGRVILPRFFRGGTARQYHEVWVTLGEGAYVQWIEGGRLENKTNHNQVYCGRGVGSRVNWRGVYVVAESAEASVTVEISGEASHCPQVDFRVRTLAPAAGHWSLQVNPGVNGRFDGEWGVFPADRKHRCRWPGWGKQVAWVEGDSQFQYFLGEVLKDFPPDYQVDLMQLWLEQAALCRDNIP